MATYKKPLINVRPGLKRNNLPIKASILATSALFNRTVFISLLKFHAENGDIELGNRNCKTQRN